MKSKSKNILLAATSMICVAILGATAYQFFGSEEQIEVAIGGPFKLMRHTGEVITDDIYRGQYMFVYFGFTHCPAICPTTLLQMTNLLNEIEKSDASIAEKITPIFISVDPERDTPKAIANYISHFHNRFDGLVGNFEDLTDLTNAYGSYFSYAPTENGDSYTVNHSSYIYLMGPKGNYITHFSPDETTEQILEQMQAKLNIS